MPVDRDRKMLEYCLDLARQSLKLGSSPVGAVVVDDSGEVLAEGRNRSGEPWPLEAREIAGSLAHAELAALFHLQEVEEAPAWTLYSSLEPCPMCAGALGLLGFGRVVWACDDPWGGLGRQRAWGEHPTLERSEVTPHPIPELETAAARLFAPAAREAYPREGWALWEARYPEAWRDVERQTSEARSRR